MTPSKGTFWGVVTVLVAFLVLSATAAAVYYGKSQAEASQNGVYSGELETALEDYRTLQTSYNASLADYNQTLSLLATAVANLNTTTAAYQEASTALSTLWGRYQALAEGSGLAPLTYEVNVLVDFGNGTSVWYNDTATLPGWDGYIVTVVVLRGDVQGQWYPQYGEHYVTGLAGVNQTSTTAWFVWEYSGGRWIQATTGVDQIAMHNGTTIAWTLCSFDSGFNPKCVP